MSEHVSQAIARRLHQAERILIVSHVRPDGDAVGSVTGLGMALEHTGKQVQMVLNDGVPHALRHIPGAERIIKRPKGEYDLFVVVDSSDLQRLGETVYGFPPPGINIDHHITNPSFAELNLVMPEAVATAAILAKFFPEWGLVITPAVAGALLAGIVTDTIGFRTSNMNPEALRLSADLMEQGASLPDLYHQSLIKRSFPAARYWGEGLHRLQRKDRLVWTSLSLEDRDSAGYTGNDDADLVNVLSSIEDADVAVIFVQQRCGEVKVSWRSQSGLDVSQIAIQFGGGGHAAAAGAEIEGTLEGVENQVLKATQAAMIPLSSLQVE